MEQLSQGMTFDDFIYRLIFMTSKYDCSVEIKVDADKTDKIAFICKDAKGEKICKNIDYYYASDIMPIDILDEIEHRIKLSKDRELY